MQSVLRDATEKYVHVPLRLLRDHKRVSTSAIVLYIVLSTHVGTEYGFIVFPSYSYIRKESGMSYQKIARALRELEEAGWIERDRTRGKGTFYTIKISDSADNPFANMKWDEETTPTETEAVEPDPFRNGSNRFRNGSLTNSIDISNKDHVDSLASLDYRAPHESLDSDSNSEASRAESSEHLEASEYQMTFPPTGADDGVALSVGHEQTHEDKRKRGYMNIFNSKLPPLVKDVAYAFMDARQMYPSAADLSLKGKKGMWVKGLFDLFHACGGDIKEYVSADLTIIPRAVEVLAKQKMTIASPESLVKTARALANPMPESVLDPADREPKYRFIPAGQ